MHWIVWHLKTYSPYPLDGSVSNDVVWSRTVQSLLSDTIRRRRLTAPFFLWLPLLCRHQSRPFTCIQGPPKHWQRRTGRPRQTWLRTVEIDCTHSVSACRCQGAYVCVTCWGEWYRGLCWSLFVNWYLNFDVLESENVTRWAICYAVCNCALHIALG